MRGRHLNYKKGTTNKEDSKLIKKQGPAGSIKVGKKYFLQDRKNYQIFKSVLQKQNLQIPANVCILSVYPDISKSIAGRCIRTSNELKFFSEFDYIIQLSGSLWDTLGEQQKYLLLYHEILHIEIAYDKDGEVKYQLKDHNVKDFKEIISKYGIDWIEDISMINSSIYDSDGEVSI